VKLPAADCEKHALALTIRSSTKSRCSSSCPLAAGA